MAKVAGRRIIGSVLAIAFAFGIALPAGAGGARLAWSFHAVKADAEPALIESQELPSPAVFEAAVRRSPGDADTYVALGLSRIAAGDVAGAEDAFRGALGITLDRGDIHLNYANTLCLRDQVEDAIAHYEASASVALVRDAALAMANAGRCLQLHGMSAEASRYYHLAVSADPAVIAAR